MTPFCSRSCRIFLRLQLWQFRSIQLTPSLCNLLFQNKPYHPILNLKEKRHPRCCILICSNVFSELLQICCSIFFGIFGTGKISIPINEPYFLPILTAFLIMLLDNFPVSGSSRYKVTVTFVTSPETLHKMLALS